MNIDTTFYDQYKNIVKSIDGLKAQPEQIDKEARLAIDDVKCYSSHLQNVLFKLEEYPLLAKSLLNLIGRMDMRGYLGIFIVDETITHVQEFIKQEQELSKQIDAMREGGDQAVLQELKRKAQSWRRIITINNIEYVGRFLLSLKNQADELYESLSVKEKLGKALEKSEEDRRRLIELEESRQRGLSEREMSREEKRQKAREEYARSIRIRKKK